MTFGGLVLIALGTGGIKPCVAAFGGDQFKDHQVTYMNHVKLCIIYYCGCQLVETSALQILFHLLFLH